MENLTIVSELNAKLDKLTFVYLSDPGHGWLRVARSDLLALLGRAVLSISPYSYQDSKWVYLEEDCDLPLLIKTLTKAGRAFELVEKITNNESPIRRYMGFELTTLEKQALLSNSIKSRYPLSALGQLL